MVRRRIYIYRFYRLQVVYGSLQGVTRYGIIICHKNYSEKPVREMLTKKRILLQHHGEKKKQKMLAVYPIQSQVALALKLFCFLQDEK